MITSPPLPPSPPEGPPRGTNFSRLKAMQPLPPSPAFTRILAASINMVIVGYSSLRHAQGRLRTGRWQTLRACASFVVYAVGGFTTRDTKFHEGNQKTKSLGPKARLLCRESVPSASARHRNETAAEIYFASIASGSTITNLPSCPLF